MLLNNSNVDYMYNKLKEILNIRINDDRNFVKYEDSLDISKEKWIWYKIILLIKKKNWKIRTKKNV